jgi:hypothetical protein
VAIGDGLTARLAVERARAINPRLHGCGQGPRAARDRPVARARRRADRRSQLEAALELARASLQRMGVSGPELVAITLGIRRRAYGELTETGLSSGPPTRAGREA